MKRIIGGLGVALGAYALLRPWMKNWGTRPHERKLAYPGDDVVSPANYVAMMAVDVDAPPEAIWPWLMQLGRGRGGLYSYDWLDRLFGYLDRPSATSILPEFSAPRGRRPNPARARALLARGGDMLLGLKQRAEALRAANTAETRANERPAA